MMLHQIVAAVAAALAMSAWAQITVPGLTKPATGTPGTGIPAAAASLPPDAVLAERGPAKVTRADYELELTRLPPDLRGGFATSEKRVADLLTRMLVTKELAIEAEETGVAREPYNAARLAYELERAKAQLRVAQLEKEAGDAFERERANFEKRAREIYRTQPQRFTEPERVQASHILFLAQKHGADEAMALAVKARARVAAGESFAKVASELSEDPGTRQEGGKLPPFARGEMDSAFEKAAFSLAPGELSQPVVSQFGAHLILVASRTPERRESWEETGPKIMAELREGYVKAQRDGRLEAMQASAYAAVQMDKVKLFVLEQPSEQEFLRLQRESMRNRARPAAKR
ncbi:MAG TPA: peptidylprolyl isomerase [Casimicrobiaceae bacterium]|nr:peptidylprolyl isomerase [Casimicrobiaceae bacterium]